MWSNTENIFQKCGIESCSKMMKEGAESSSVVWESRMSLRSLFDSRRRFEKFDNRKDYSVCLGLALLYGSWNKSCASPAFEEKSRALLSRLLAESTDGLIIHRYAAMVEIDSTDEDLEFCIGDGDSFVKRLALPPKDMPAFAILCHTKGVDNTNLRYISSVQASTILSAICKSKVDTRAANLHPLRKAIESVEDEYDLSVVPHKSCESLRIFIAGDRSSVGKSSVCLGILGNLLHTGYPASSLAYIKPATQSEATQLIERYCLKNDIRCVPVGPLVYYRGFTRAFLAGETDSTEELLASCGRAVDRVSRGKQIVLIDGVGFPAVGSICGTDNAQVLRACSYPFSETQRRNMGVVLVGGVGVGGAIDSFNMNAAYFEQSRVKVLGAIFNKLPETGFYSLENCRAQVSAYFRQNEKQVRLGRELFGFVPLYPFHSKSDSMSITEDFIEVFGAHVDIQGILRESAKLKEAGDMNISSRVEPDVKRRKLSTTRPKRRREEIEALAVKSGAKKSA